MEVFYKCLHCSDCLIEKFSWYSIDKDNDYLKEFHFRVEMSGWLIEGNVILKVVFIYEKKMRRSPRTGDLRGEM